MEVGTDRAIAGGRIVLVTESGDSVAAHVTGDDGSFSVESSEAGSFLLVASAFGYHRRVAGIFELGVGGEMTVEFRLAPEPMTLEGLVATGTAESAAPYLVSSGFYRRMQVGLGHFITPADLERLPALRTTDLFVGIPGVVVRTDALGGDRILMRSPEGYCSPTVWVDGMRVGADHLDDVAPRVTLEGIEIYRRPAEIPLRYLGTGLQICGVIVVWTRYGNP